MKAQKLGLFLGMNMAVACMVMQRCKAVKPGQGAQSPAYVAPVVETDPAPAPAPQPEPLTPSAAPTSDTASEPQPEPPAPDIASAPPSPQSLHSCKSKHGSCKHPKRPPQTT